MLVTADSTPATPAVDALPLAVFRHRRRRQWGLAAIVWEHDGKRGYRFEDGSERTFKEGYYELFEAVAPVTEGARALLAAIERDAEKKDETQSGSRRRKRTPVLSELVQVFRRLFPDGFGDPSWTAKRRGEGAKRRAKRHRNAAIEDAAQQLGREALDGLLAQGDAEGVLQRCVDVLGATDLVTRKQLDALRSAVPNLELAQALRDLLHDADPEGIRFNRVLALLVRAGGQPSWQLVTGLLMLVDPQQHICVRPSVFFDMVSALSPSRGRKVSPEGGQYARLDALARDLLVRLREAGEQPRDMLDVYDFIWETCRPAARELLEDVRRDALAASTKADDAPASASTESSAAKENPAEPSAASGETKAASSVTKAASSDAQAEADDPTGLSDLADLSDVEAAEAA